MQRLEHHLVERGEQIDQLIAAAAHLFALGQAHRVLQRVGGGKVDALLALGHVLDILLERDLLVLGRVEDQQILQEIFIAAVLVADADLEMIAEVLEELLVLRPVVAHELFELALDLLFKILADDAQLAVVLQDLAGDVQAQIRRVDHALDELEIVVHELVALLHDHDAVGIERDAALVLAIVQSGVLLAGDKEHRLVGHGALGVNADEGAGVLHVAVLLFIIGDAVVVGDFIAAALPDGDHAVDRLGLRHGLVFIFRRAVVVLLAGLLAFLARDVHADRPTHIIRVLAHERLELPDLEISAVQLVVGVGLKVHDHVGADALALAGRDGIAVGAGALPHHAALLAVLAGDDRDLVGDHEGGVEAHAELADDGQVLALALFHVVFEAQRAGLCDHAEVVFRFLRVHADAVVADRQRARFLVGDDLDAKIVAVKTDLVVGQREIAELVDRVRGVGDDLAQKDLLVRIDRIDHQVEQTLGLGLELLLCHGFCLPPFRHN